MNVTIRNASMWKVHNTFIDKYIRIAIVVQNGTFCLLPTFAFYYIVGRSIAFNPYEITQLAVALLGWQKYMVLKK